MARVLIFYPHLDREGGYPGDFRELVAALYTQEPGIRSATTLRAVRQSLSTDPPELAHLIGLFLWQLIPAAVLMRYAGVPYVITTLAQESPALVRRGRWLAKALWLVAYSRIVASHSAGRHTFSSWEERLGLPVENVMQAGLPIHSQMGFPLRKPAFGEGEEVQDLPWFLFVGRKEINQKGLDLLLYALGEVANESDAPILARIAGVGDLETDERLRTITQSCGIASRVQISGQIEALDASSARFFVYPSRFDGPPRPVRAALAAGMPVIITEETGMGDAVRHYGAGLVCGASVPQLAVALSQALASPEEFRRHASQSAFQLAESLHPSRVAASFVSWYSRTIRNEAGGSDAI